MKRASILFYAISIFFLLGHTVVPHQHFENQNIFTSPQEHCHDLVDLLKCVFSQDLGKNHLKDFFNQSDLPNINAGIQSDKFQFPDKILTVETNFPLSNSQIPSSNQYFHAFVRPPPPIFIIHC